MKRISTLFFLVMGVSAGSFAQSNITVTDGMGHNITNDTVTIAGTSGEVEVIAEHYYVHNIGSTTIDIKCKRQEVSIVDGSTAALCWMVCSAYYAKGAQPNLLAPGGAYTSAPNDSVDLFKLHYQSNGNVGTSLYKVIFFNQAVASDTAVLWVKFDIALGMKELAKTYSLNAYPNPANSMVTIDAGNTSNGYIRIMDVLGNTVKTLPVNTNTMRVNTSDLKEGVYFYSLIDNNKAVITRRLVIAR